MPSDSLVNSSLVERFFIVLSKGIHFGEFFLGREVFYRTLSTYSLWWILPSSTNFFIGLSAGIHVGEFFLHREVSCRNHGRDSRRWILPSPRGFFNVLSAGILVNRPWPRCFIFGLSVGIHIGEFFLGRKCFYRTLGRDSLWWILPWPRGFLSYSR